MNKNLFISIYLDTRRAKANGKYPVKLRVFTASPRVQKLYPTVFELTKKEFESIWETAKPRNEWKQIRQELIAVESKANEVAELLSPFSFVQFEKRLFRKSGDGQNVEYQYLTRIQHLKSLNQIGTASTYELSFKSFKGFMSETRGKEIARLSFIEITPEWLERYEAFMIGTKGRSRTTVSMYLRTLRAIFNHAISENEIPKEIYPFGKRKYQIPAVKNIKKALTGDQLRALFEMTPKTPEQEKAKDFWFFSYACNGINIKDIALLRNESIQGDQIVFYRAKTIKTAKADLKPVVVYLNEYAKSIIDKYRSANRNPKELLFTIVSDSNSQTINYNLIKNFTKFINQNLKKLLLDEGVELSITTYSARHSFATQAIRNGASMEFVSEALSHSSMKTTQGYFAGFEEESKKELMQRLMKF